MSIGRVGAWGPKRDAPTLLSLTHTRVGVLWPSPCCQIEADIRREREAAQFSYFGKPGGGAPIRDDRGNVR